MRQETVHSKQKRRSYKGTMSCKRNSLQIHAQRNSNRAMADNRRRLNNPSRTGNSNRILYKIPDEAEATYQLFAVTDNNEMEMVYADYRYPTDFQQYWTILYKNGISLIRNRIIRRTIPKDFQAQLLQENRNIEEPNR